MSNSKKLIWIAFALFMFFQMGTSYITNKNQDNLSFLMEMKGYIPFMLYFSMAGIVLFLLSFMVYQMDGMKAKKQIAQLEQDKNELKAKLFDMQEEHSKKTELPAIPTPAPEPITDPTPELPDSSEEKPD